MSCPPTFVMLAQLQAASLTPASCARRMHPNPQLFKYYWWVFHAGSPAEGAAFFQPEFRIATHAMSALTARLESVSEPYLIYNKRLPRTGANITFNPTCARWHNIEWAPAYDDDRDPEINGFR